MFVVRLGHICCYVDISINAINHKYQHVPKLIFIHFFSGIGAAYIIFGGIHAKDSFSFNWVISEESPLPTTHGFTLYCYGCGVSIGAVGDVDDDGIADFLVSNDHDATTVDGTRIPPSKLSCFRAKQHLR